MYLSPERYVVSRSLKSLGLSKDPKDAQRRPSCFPEVQQRLRNITYELAVSFPRRTLECNASRRPIIPVSDI